MPSINCTYMRSGTSKGPYFDLRDFPTDIAARDEILLKIMGSPNQIDGLGGGSFVTSKVVFVEPSDKNNADVNYLFAQVAVDKNIVDTKPNCGNMMAGVAAFAIENNWVKASDDKTIVRVFNQNSQSLTEITVETPNGIVNYSAGNCAIDGVLGTAAAVELNSLAVGGGATGKLLPTGNTIDVIDGVAITLIDCGNLVALMAADSFAINFAGSIEEQLSQSTMATIESLRRAIAKKAGLGDVSNSVLPKVALLSAAKNAGTINSLYLTPHTVHPAHAVTGAYAVAAACMLTNTVATAKIIPVFTDSKQLITIEHPSGKIPITIAVDTNKQPPIITRAGTYRTVRKIMQGKVFY